MKRTVSLLLALLLVLPLAACTAGGPAASASPTPTAQSLGKPQENLAVYRGKIVSLSEKSLLLAGMGDDGGSGRLCSLSPDGLAMTDDSGAPLSPEDLTAGMTVEVSYSGEIMETYPCGLGGPTSLRVTGVEDDFVGLYLRVLEDLYAVDSGLNDGVSVLALDLSGEQNLTESEKSALLWLFSGEHGAEPLSGTFDELCEQGYIDREDLIFETGLLFTITGGAAEAGKFSFNAQKWRSGLGAYYFQDCTATEKDGAWSYTVGSEAIS